jgi:GDPmannose 4,6-dehydratase
MWRIVQQPEADDYVLATGQMQSVRMFVEMAFAHVGRDIAWSGKGVDEIGIDKKSGRVVVRVDPAYFRPTEVDLLLGDPTKARERLGWEHKTTLKELVTEMMEADLHLAELERRGGNAAVQDMLRTIVFQPVKRAAAS